MTGRFPGLDLVLADFKFHPHHRVIDILKVGRLAWIDVHFVSTRMKAQRDIERTRQDVITCWEFKLHIAPVFQVVTWAAINSE
jgi:predicted Co/Zn/Cd cation transporter (cation efflux family)